MHDEMGGQQPKQNTVTESMCKMWPAMRTENGGEYACESSFRRRRTSEITHDEATDGACGVPLVKFSHRPPVKPVVRWLFEGGENADIGISVTLALGSCAMIAEEGIDALGEVG